MPQIHEYRTAVLTRFDMLKYVPNKTLQVDPFLALFKRERSSAHASRDHFFLYVCYVCHPQLTSDLLKCLLCLSPQLTSDLLNFMLKRLWKAVKLFILITLMILNFPKLVQSCSILFKLVQTCPNLFKLVQTHPNSSKLVQTRTENIFAFI